MYTFKNSFKINFYKTSNAKCMSCELNSESKLCIQELQQIVFLATKISKEIFFIIKNTDLATKYRFRC